MQSPREAQTGADKSGKHTLAARDWLHIGKSVARHLFVEKSSTMPSLRMRWKHTLCSVACSRTWIARRQLPNLQPISNSHQPHWCERQTLLAVDKLYARAGAPLSSISAACTMARNVESIPSGQHLDGLASEGPRPCRAHTAQATPHKTGFPIQGDM